MGKKLHVLTSSLGDVDDILSYLNAMKQLYMGIQIIDRVVDQVSNMSAEQTPEEKLILAIYGDSVGMREDLKKERKREKKEKHLSSKQRCALQKIIMLIMIDCSLQRLMLVRQGFGSFLANLTP